MRKFTPAELRLIDRALAVAAQVYEDDAEAEAHRIVRDAMRLDAAEARELAGQIAQGFVA